PEIWDYVAPRNPTEEALAEIWCEVLEVDRVGVHDNFFELGGHSLSAVKLIDACNRALSATLPVRALFDYSTVEALATAVGQVGKPKFSKVLVPLQTTGRRTPIFCIHPAGGLAFCYSEFVTHFGPDQPVYALQDSGLMLAEPLAVSIEAMAASYIDAIRAVQPHGPYQLLGWSFGGLVAYEMAHQLGDDGEKIALLVLLDTKIPDVAETSSPTEAELIAGYIAARGWDFPKAISSVPELVEVLRSRGLIRPDFSIQMGQRIAAVHMNAIGLAKRYRPPKLHNSLVYVHATLPQNGMEGPTDVSDWSPLLAGEQTIVHI